ncbi:MAG: sugar ABC transporter substrate-binding protein [Cyanobacteriota bacterium]|nr:sugar ABC transporter substrate-binding protein [Cyanobacteriota bacterium]
MQATVVMAWSRRHFLSSSAALALGSCAARRTAPAVASSIRFWTMQLKPTFDAYMQERLTAFAGMAEGVPVEWVDVPWGDMENKILTAVAANTGPDVVNLNPQFASRLAEKNALVDLAPLLSPSQQAVYFPNLWRANQLGSVTFGLPWYVATDITLYNRDLLRQADWDPDQPPQTYSQLASAAIQIRQKTGKPGFMLTMDGSQMLEAMVLMDMALLDEEGQAAFDDAIGREAFAYWVDLLQAGGIPRETLTESHRRAIELYQAGELAMLLTGPQLLTQIVENAPQIAQVSDVAPQIAGSQGRKSASVMNLVIPQKSQNIPAALQFALFLTNSPNQLAFAQIANTLPSTIATVSDPYFTQSTSDSLLEKARLLSAAQLSQSEVLIPPMQGLDDLRKIIYEELQLAMLQQKTVDQAVTDAATRWNQRL